MRLKFTQDFSIQIGTAEGIVAHEYRAGQTADVPDDVAVMFINQGAAEPAAAEKAVKPAAKRAVKE